LYDLVIHVDHHQVEEIQIQEKSAIGKASPTQSVC